MKTCTGTVDPLTLSSRPAVADREPQWRMARPGNDPHPEMRMGASARNVPSSYWVCRNCAWVGLEMRRFWCIGGWTVLSGHLCPELAVTQPIERDAI